MSCTYVTLPIVLSYMAATHMAEANAKGTIFFAVHRYMLKVVLRELYMYSREYIS